MKKFLIRATDEQNTLYYVGEESWTMFMKLAAKFSTQEAADHIRRSVYSPGHWTLEVVQ